MLKKTFLICRCGGLFEDLDLCIYDDNLLTTAIGNEIAVPKRVCNVTEDCNQLISHWNLRKSFRADLQMNCSSGYCRSTNEQLWTKGTIIGEDFCHQKLKMGNIFDIKEPGPLRDRSFPRF